MLYAGHDLPFRGMIRSKLVGDHHAWRTSLTHQELAHEAFGRFGVAAALNQNLQDEPILEGLTKEASLLSISTHILQENEEDRALL